MPALQSNQYTEQSRDVANTTMIDRRRCPLRLATSALAAVLLTIPLAGKAAASAALLDEVANLNRAGNSTAALARADEYLASNPRDAQMRFLKSVVLADMGRSDEAEALLRQLAQAYPELAEPHNNLAAIYASRGQFDVAQTELLESLRLDPGYATAYENLGDVYLKLAEQAYSASLKHGAKNAKAADKLTALRKLADH